MLGVGMLWNATVLASLDIGCELESHGRLRVRMALYDL